MPLVGTSKLPCCFVGFFRVSLSNFGSHVKRALDIILATQRETGQNLNISIFTLGGPQADIVLFSIPRNVKEQVCSFVCFESGMLGQLSFQAIKILFSLSFAQGIWRN